ncbi:hypothetical protein MJO29_014379 [Puccinia striiformis f. sp. tritici]|nr:hypothetical protein MJO29_014379 [Puccinia striiformis f. sp. tritici]
MSSPPRTGNTSANRPSSPFDYTLSDITGYNNLRAGTDQLNDIFDCHLGAGWESRLSVSRPPRQRAYSETDTTVTSFRIPGSFVPPRPSTPLPRRQAIPDFTPPSQSSSRLPPQPPTQSTPFRFQSSPRPLPTPYPRNRQPRPTDLSFILSPSFSFRQPTPFLRPHPLHHLPDIDNHPRRPPLDEPQHHHHRQHLPPTCLITTLPLTNPEQLSKKSSSSSKN